ncbi:MAG: hypothetical protein MJ233_03635 [Mycoplasmoidaceae bacterium]|nr:hypothetical protein [Mycoplasmoidaceae bacterium]
MAFAYDGKSDEDAPLVIKQIDFETNCVCAKFGNGTFTGCTNLETVIFPPKYKPEDLSPFGYCPKLKTFDLSNMAENIAYEEVNQNFIIDSETFPDNGQIIIKRGQTNVDGFVKYLTAKLEGKN